MAKDGEPAAAALSLSTLMGVEDFEFDHESPDEPQRQDQHPLLGAGDKRDDADSIDRDVADIQTVEQRRRFFQAVEEDRLRFSAKGGDIAASRSVDNGVSVAADILAFSDDDDDDDNGDDIDNNGGVKDTRSHSDALNRPPVAGPGVAEDASPTSGAGHIDSSGSTPQQYGIMLGLGEESDSDVLDLNVEDEANALNIFGRRQDQGTQSQLPSVPSGSVVGRLLLGRGGEDEDSRKASNYSEGNDRRSAVEYTIKESESDAGSDAPEGSTKWSSKSRNTGRKSTRVAKQRAMEEIQMETERLRKVVPVNLQAIETEKLSISSFLQKFNAWSGFSALEVPEKAATLPGDEGTKQDMQSVPAVPKPGLPIQIGTVLGSQGSADITSTTDKGQQQQQRIIEQLATSEKPPPQRFRLQTSDDESYEVEVVDNRSLRRQKERSSKSLNVSLQDLLKANDRSMCTPVYTSSTLVRGKAGLKLLNKKLLEEAHLRSTRSKEGVEDSLPPNQAQTMLQPLERQGSDNTGNEGKASVEGGEQEARDTLSEQEEEEQEEQEEEVEVEDTDAGIVRKRGNQKPKVSRLILDDDDDNDDDEGDQSKANTDLTADNEKRKESFLALFGMKAKKKVEPGPEPSPGNAALPSPPLQSPGCIDTGNTPATQYSFLATQDAPTPATQATVIESDTQADASSAMQAMPTPVRKALNRAGVTDDTREVGGPRSSNEENLSTNDRKLKRLQRYNGDFGELSAGEWDQGGIERRDTCSVEDNADTSSGKLDRQASATEPRKRRKPKFRSEFLESEAEESDGDEGDSEAEQQRRTANAMFRWLDPNFASGVQKRSESDDEEEDIDSEQEEAMLMADPLIDHNVQLDADDELAVKELHRKREFEEDEKLTRNLIHDISAGSLLGNRNKRYKGSIEFDEEEDYNDREARAERMRERRRARMRLARQEIHDKNLAKIAKNPETAAFANAVLYRNVSSNSDVRPVVSGGGGGGYDSDEFLLGGDDPAMYGDDVVDDSMILSAVRTLTGHYHSAAASRQNSGQKSTASTSTSTSTSAANRGGGKP